MKDPAFIQQMIEKGIGAKEKVKAEFSTLSSSQLNWQPSNDEWSIAQCLEHLIIADGLRNQIIKKKITQNFRSGTWERINPLKNFWGLMLVTQSQEKIHKKIKAPGRFQPSTTTITEDIQLKFEDYLDNLLNDITACEKADLDKVFVTSPVSGLVTYSLRNAIAIIIGHQYRHINQAIKVKHLSAFPS